MQNASTAPTAPTGMPSWQQIMFTRELQKRYGSRGLSAAAFHPGVVATSFSSSPGTSMEAIYGSKILSKFLDLTPEGRQTPWSGWPTESAHIDWPAGEYFTRRKVSRTNRQAKDPGLSDSLWERTEALLKDG